MTEPAEPRQVLGVVLRGIRAELDRRGLTGRVLERLRGEARDALEHPPMHGTWMPAALHDQVIQAIAEEANRRTVRDVIYELSRTTTGPLALPLMKTFLSLFGLSPVSLLDNLGRISALHMRYGIHFRYQPETGRSGWVTVTYAEPVDPVQFATWEGVLLFGKDLFRLSIITVDAAVPLPGGCAGRIYVAW